MIPFGERSKLSFTALTILSFQTFSVSKVLIYILTGFATQIAYQSCISHLSHTPEATMFLARYLAIYAPLLSTFDGSFPENAHPQCLPIQP